MKHIGRLPSSSRLLRCGWALALALISTGQAEPRDSAAAPHVAASTAPAASGVSLKTFEGDHTLVGDTHLVIAGETRGRDHDAIEASGALTLRGDLDILLTTASPRPGRYRLFSAAAGLRGTFAAVTLADSFASARLRREADGAVWSGSFEGHAVTFHETTGELVIRPAPETPPAS